MRIVEELEAHGLLTPILKGGREATRMTSYLKDDVEDLIASCCKGSDASPETLAVTLSFIEARRQVRFEILCRAMLGGKLEPACLNREAIGLRQLRFHAHDIAALRKYGRRRRNKPIEAPPPMDFSFWRERIAVLRERAGR